VIGCFNELFSQTSRQNGNIHSLSLDGWWKLKQGEYVKNEQISDSVKLPGTMDTNNKRNPKEISFTEEIPNVGELNISPDSTELTNHIIIAF
jgi:hypothetical protein